MIAAQRHQVAALPMRVGPSGRKQILLITSRERKRWIIPKGWPMKGKPDWEAAAIEAFEEAGVSGKIEEFPFGSYEYEKINRAGIGKILTVQVYILNVEEREKNWPEKDQRVSLWYDFDETLIVLDEPGLAQLIARHRLHLR